MTENQQSPILKAHAEGKEMFKKQFVTTDCWVSAFPEDVLSFLTTYAEMILNGAREAGPGEIKKDNDLKLGNSLSQKERLAGMRMWNRCRLTFRSSIDEGIKEIKNQIN